MRLLVDTDLFCKLGVAGLFDRTLAALGMGVHDCRRLAALPHMLRRGKLPSVYGRDGCAALVPAAESIGSAPAASAKWLEPLLPIAAIDPGEAQLFALTAEFGPLLATGDKRALRAISKVSAFQQPLARKIVTFEALLLRLLSEIGSDALRRALLPLATDQLVKICFSPSNPDAASGLRSYFDSLQRETQPLLLWDPAEGGSP